jgi:hypothetical protein
MGMGIINIEKFWPKELKQIVEQLNNTLNFKNFSKAKQLMEEIMDILADPNQNIKVRISICFLIEQVKNILPLVSLIVDKLISILEIEKEDAVKEFCVWALGLVVEESQDLDLIKKTMPIFIKFCSDSSEQVKLFAQNLKERLEEIMRVRKDMDEQIEKASAEILIFVNSCLQDMKNRSDIISEKALKLDYKSAFEKKEEMEKEIRVFKEKNQQQEQLIIQKLEEKVKEIPAFKFESNDILRQYREKRGKQEDIIRKVHCILRIQSKIYKIISFIKQSSDGKIDIKKLKKETDYSEAEIINILKQLVNEEIIPNFMLENIENIDEDSEHE